MADRGSLVAEIRRLRGRLGSRRGSKAAGPQAIDEEIVDTMTILTWLREQEVDNAPSD